MPRNAPPEVLVVLAGPGGVNPPSVRGVGRAGGLTPPTKMRVVVGLAGILGGVNPPPALTPAHYKVIIQEITNSRKN